MTFTYNLSGTGAGLTISEIRLEIGDTDSTTGRGVKPDATNFTDAEITYFYNQESSNVIRAAARACEVLARSWATVPDWTVGPRHESAGQVAQRFTEMAKELRARIGRTGPVRLNRTDAYTTDGGEYS